MEGPFYSIVSVIKLANGSCEASCSIIGYVPLFFVLMAGRDHLTQTANCVGD